MRAVSGPEIVVGPDVLGSSTLAPRRAREVVQQALEPLGVGALQDDVLLVISELVTNAVVHGGAAPALVLRVGDERLVVEVHDPSPVVPQPLVADPARIGGWGLGLVARLTDRWGVKGTELGGKAVWAEFELE